MGSLQGILLTLLVSALTIAVLLYMFRLPVADKDDDAQGKQDAVARRALRRAFAQTSLSFFQFSFN